MCLALVKLCNSHHWIQRLRAFWWRLRGIVNVCSKALNHLLHSFQLALLQPMLTQFSCKHHASCKHHTERIVQTQCHLDGHE